MKNLFNLCDGWFKPAYLKGNTLTLAGFSHKVSQKVLLSTVLVLSGIAHADSVSLAERPLSAPSGTIKPNLMFVFDTSGSMASDLPNDTLTDYAQCKATTKDRGGHGISKLTIGPTLIKPSNPNTVLTIYSPNSGDYSVNQMVYLTVPGKPTLSGKYKIQVKNTASTGCVSGTNVYNSSVIVNNPYKYNESAAQIEWPFKAGQSSYVNGDPPTMGCAVTTPDPGNSGSTTNTVWTGQGYVVDQLGVTSTPNGACYWRDDPDVIGCAVTSTTPANSGSTTTNYWLGGGKKVNPDGTVTTTDSSSCQWYDPIDNAIGTVWQSCTTGTTGENSLEVTIASDTPATLTASEILDARILPNGDDGKCYGEPPQYASKVQTLFYDPEVSYRPPPWPKKVGQGLPAPLDVHLSNLNAHSASHNLLPNMDRATTSNWRNVRLDGLQLDAAGNQNGAYWGGATNSTSNVGLASARAGMGFNRWTEMVYCDTPDRPAAFSTDRAWMESNRCARNRPGTNDVNKSPNWPYKYPEVKKGGADTPSTANWAAAMVEHQNGQGKGAKNPIFDFDGDKYRIFGEYYRYAVPFYYRIKPIEYCREAKLRTCIIASEPSGQYIFPSYVRYCRRDTHATSTTGSNSINCQGTYTGSYTNTTTPGLSDWRFARYGLFEKVEVREDVTSYPKGANRKDCAGATCTYDEEMTNIANWFTYYRTRMMLMKTAAARTFETLNENYRVGLITVEGYNTAGNYLPIKDFVTGTNLHKQKWFETLYSRTASGGTSLRDVLSTVGRIYAGKKPITGFTAVTDDPVQYSCQQNFTLLTTDGYWNGPAGKKIDGASLVGNQDAAPTPLPKREGPVAVDTLADVAKYYYDTDIRNVAHSNCIGGLGADVCLDDVQASGEDTKATQHMTTFTLGLGVDGSLTYNPDYKTELAGDYASIKAGTVTWPAPTADDGNTTFTAAERATVDDLWHAAVNGTGTYFSARNPNQLIGGISSTLLALGDLPATGSATALSNSTPIPGDNYTYSARYVTGKWTGNLIARTIDAEGNKSANAVWCVENEASTTPPCTGTLANKVSANADTRNIYTNVGSSSSPSMESFEYDNLNATQRTYFSSTYLSTRLSQYAGLTAYQLTKVGTTSLVNYLRGRTGFDKRNSNDLGGTTDNRLYRQRDATLGDIVESDPVFVGKSSFAYTDDDYASFKASTSSRTEAVYVGANDGMLHAFDKANGKELWAYVPSAVLPNMWKLADENYRNIHTNYVNAKMSVADVYIGGVWKTILVSGLGQGGRGYFALDITDPLSPSLLWEIDSDSESNLGYSYGKPVITKRGDGKWVVLVTSGYNNTSPGTGEGRLFVLDAESGDVLSDIGTSTGGTSTPSGLAQVSAFVEHPDTNNQAQYVYGGDLLGNLWRFDIDSESVMKFTELTDGSGEVQPVMVAPVLGVINGKRVVFIGTGKYLEFLDLLPAEYKQQTLYAIKDDNVATTIGSLRSQMEKQTLVGTSDSRSASGNEPDWTTQLGWYVDLNVSGERQNVKARLEQGVLIVPTIVPPTSSCDQGGSGWVNVFNYKTGGAVLTSAGTQVSWPTTSPVTGLPIIFGASGSSYDGSIIALPDLALCVTCLNPNGPPPITPPSLSTFERGRAVWRELIIEEQ
ncbi:MAG: PQQ-binding-like beta-propeller repeat protein [Methylotenera sp.]|nr:PQQ-binding-like beta-propeller repeat protein [Methylotenera sp.]